MGAEDNIKKGFSFLPTVWAQLSLNTRLDCALFVLFLSRKEIFHEKSRNRHGQRQRSARSLVTRDGRRQERDVRSEKLLREGQWNRGSFIDEEKLCLREFVGLGGHDVLNDLTVRFEDVHTDDDVRLVLLRGVDNLVVRVLLDGVSASVEWL